MDNSINRNDFNCSPPPNVAAILTRLERRLERLERRLDDVADDTDALDRFNRPYGDGTRLARRRHR